MTEQPSPPAEGGRRRRRRIDWAGRVALVLAIAVGGGWAIALIISATPWTDVISDAGADLLSVVGGVLAGAIAGYIGSQIPSRRDNDDDPEA